MIWAFSNQRVLNITEQLPEYQSEIYIYIYFSQIYRAAYLANRELKQRGWERQRERCKTMD